MKHKLQLLICCLLLSIGAFSQNIPAYVPTNGLIAWYPFNGNANDESGNGYNGIVNGATLTADRNGSTNKAYSFNGTNTYINSSNIATSISTKTICAWVKLNSLTQSGGGIAGIQVSGGSIFDAIVYNETSNGWGFGSDYYSRSAWANQAEISTGWIFLVAVYESNNYKLYRDGQLILTTTSFSAINFPSGSRFNIGLRHTGPSNAYINGSIDDISIYSRALTQTEITALYTGVPPCTPISSTTSLTIPSTSLPYTWNGLTFNAAGSQTKHLSNASGCDSLATLNLTVNYTLPNYITTNGLLGYWPFNGNANDESGNGNHGTVNGATLTTDRNGTFNASYHFNGSKILIPLTQQMVSMSSRTISLWFKSITGQSGGRLFEATNYSWGTGCYNSNQFDCWYQKSNQAYVFVGETFQSNNLWNCLVFICDSASQSKKIYLNGILINSGIPVSNPGDPTSWQNHFLNIGQGNTNESFIGSIDDIAIYNRALTQQEITQLFTGVVTYNISASSGANGIITPSGSTSVNSGASQTYTFTPNPGYWIDSVIVNGIQVPTASSYTFNNVTSNQSIRVTYRSLATALASANICSNDTTVATVNLPATSHVRATKNYSYIYLFNQNNTGNAYKYNVNDRKYTAIADKPTPCIECGVADANGKIYCFNTNGTTQAYDIASNTWQTQTNQPSSSTSSVYAASINNKIYVLGYNNNQAVFNQFNPQTNSFTSLTSSNYNTSQSRLVAYNNLIYKIGGINTTTNTTSTAVEVYNPTNNTWTNLPDLPEALSHVGATNYDNKLYVFGGKQSTASNSSNSNKVYVFDIAGNTWYAQGNILNFQRANIEAKTANGLVYLFGGTDSSNTTTNQALRYFCKDQLCTCKWAEYVCNGVSSDNPCPTSSLYRPGTVFCNGYATKVVEVTNPITGRTWMDRNLGASRAATSSTDSLAYGDLYQWGRGSDGHQCRNSTTTTTLSSTDQPGHGMFILAPNSPFDWRVSQNDNLWQGVNGINNPCPLGYRIPSSVEFENERISWSQNNSNGAFSSSLRLPMAGGRDNFNSLFNSKGSYGTYWSSKTFGANAFYPNFHNSNAGVGDFYRSLGYSVRCIKD